ncbi:uncharacterized protein SPSK_05980 [Sporothrix schenckii 1099-18]|uniref:C2 NT-type domain-containing protein n=1 Tax=Sporothrix schenckii 1099-18 TaxID=1397361 RepID=A0A0F2MJ87_SPOSC|nr:uncharacterized protein SPSK_05980 [Sporothrix schenckii 1099-18]KJR89682.1 hypothetical protein SPSK_05980 [Sporothrix schenckii 1099-18]
MASFPFKIPSSGKAIADLTVPVHKSRKPKFELHLKIYDLNKVPLASGVSAVKWFFPHSIHGEHRGRTHKRPIANHRVEYDYSKIIPLRLVVDRNNRLSDYPIEFEITQEFESHGAGRDEKIVLGKISLNLAEYVAESEALQRDIRPTTSDSYGSRDLPGGASSSWHTRHRSSTSKASTLATSVGTIDSTASGPGGAPSSTAGSSVASLTASVNSAVEDGVIRRYLMQDSKINSTLKIGILMVQLDGEHNYVAPPLKSAPVFGGITGIVANTEPINAGDSNIDDPEEYARVGGVVGAMMAGSSAAKGHETAEIQDVYCRALAASWACQAGEMPADECIEDIFSGGDGFRSSNSDFHHLAEHAAAAHALSNQRHHDHHHYHSGGGGSKQIAPMPTGTSLGAVKARQGWSPTSPTPSSIHEEGDEDGFVSSAPSRTNSGGKKHQSILPRLGPMRRKPTPQQMGGSHSGGGNAGSSLRKSRFGDGDTKSSGEDGSGSNGSGNTSSSNNHTHNNRGDADDDDDDSNFGGPGNNATLRPSDIRKFRDGASHLGGPTSASFPALAGKHGLPGRELSGLSDRTVTPQNDTDLLAHHTSAMSMALGSRSSRSSPGPQSPTASSFNLSHRRDNSSENLASTGAAGAAASSRTSGSKGSGHGSRRPTSSRVPSSSSRKSSGHASGHGSGNGSGSGNASGNGSGHDEDGPQGRELHEYEIRDDFVAWRLPGSVAASS